MEVIDFLRKNSLQALKEKYAININRHKKYPNLVQLRYSQIDSPMRESLVHECRGIILDENKNWEIISYPFKKFFNYDEVYATKIDWNNAKVYEKIDGSIVTLYFYDNKWNLSSSSMPDASGEVRRKGCTIEELFWEIWNNLNYQLPEDKNFCYIFEMVSPFTQVLVPQKENNIFLIGARNLKTLNEEFPEKFKNSGWQIVKSFSIKTIDEVVEICKLMNPMKQEGFVICDVNFNRVKAKSPQYVSIGLLRGLNDEFVTRYILDIVRTNEGSEFLSYKPEYTELYNKVKLKYDSLVNELEIHYDNVKNIEDNREFGIKCKDTKFPNLFFNLKNKKISSVKVYLYNMNIKFLEQALGLKN